MKDAWKYTKGCEKCQHSRTINKRWSMSLHNILAIEIFDYWSVYFMDLFPSSSSFHYILVQ